MTPHGTSSLTDLPGKSGHRPVVMIVDDERVIANTLTVIFRKHGYATLTAYNAKSALETARSVPPDLLISDVIMPEISGVDLAISMLVVVPTCKILLLSGQAATVDLLAHARNEGYDFDTLAKPIHPKEMLARAAACLMQ